MSPKQPDPITIKKYANRRLYNTDTSTYITLDDLCQMVKEGKDFCVVDANSGSDLTAQVLTQVILEQELKGSRLLPASFLRSVIGFYDNNMGGVMGHYLEASMKSFVQNQDKMRGMMGDVGKAMTGMTPIAGPLGSLEEMARSNMALFEKTMSMFSPFGNVFGQPGDDKSAAHKPTDKKK